MFIRVVALALVLSASYVAMAQDEEKPKAGPIAADTKAPLVVSAIDVKPGDRWTYDLTDDITGEKTGTVTYVVTEIVDNTLSVQSIREFPMGKPPASGMTVFDLHWNFIEDSTWKRTPGSALTGIVLPLTVGTKWETKSKAVRHNPDLTVKTLGYSEVMGAETVVLPFNRSYDALRIEAVERTVNAEGPKFESTAILWYAPDVNRYVKRSFESRANGRLASRTIETLRSYTRRKSQD